MTNSNGSNLPPSNTSQEPGSSESRKNNGIKKLFDRLHIKPKKNHAFWSTQPVNESHVDDDPSESQQEDTSEGPIEAAVPATQVQAEPYALPKEFEWCAIDLHDDTQLEEVHQLLSDNYVEDVASDYRFAYSAPFLRWALLVPGYIASWHIGVRVASNKRLVAFISGVPQRMRLRNKDMACAEINFLCVHKKLRTKRLTPVLIKEVTRRCHLKGVFQAVYTAGTSLPGVIGTGRYYHRVLNAQKLVEAGFAAVPRDMTMFRFIKHTQVPQQTKIEGFREMAKRDTKAVAHLLRAYLNRFALAPVFQDTEIAHLFLKGRGAEGPKGQRLDQVTWAYVVEDPETKLITDFVSFYSLPSTIVKPNKHKHVQAAYLYYYATDSVLPENYRDQAPVWTEDQPPMTEVSQQRLHDLVYDAIIMASKAGFDVMNAVTVLDNNQIFESTQFSMGTGTLNYYIYNYKSMPVNCGEASSTYTQKSSQMGLVLL